MKKKGLSRITEVAFALLNGGDRDLTLRLPLTLCRARHLRAPNQRHCAGNRLHDFSSLIFFEG
jgi:hypothetical protein